MDNKGASLLPISGSESNHELFRSLDKTSVPVEEISSIQDPRATSVLIESDQKSEYYSSKHNEKPKVVASISRNEAFYRSLVHVPAISMTIGVLSLSFKGIFWVAPTSYTNIVLNILQFVAKIHETLVVLSLTAIVFHRIRFEIMARHGIPFGLLSSGLQFSSLANFTRADFRQIFGSVTQIRRNGGLISIIVLSFLLAIASGPSAAIAVLPRLEWWPVRELNNTALPIIYLKTTLGLLFPSVLNAPDTTCSEWDLETHGCFIWDSCVPSVNSHNWCPASGLNTILSSGVMEAVIFGDRVLSPFQAIMSTTDSNDMRTFSRALNGNIFRGALGKATTSLFLASTVLDVTGVALGNFWQTQSQTNNLARPMAKTFSTQRGIASLRKPLVQAQCTGSYHDLTSSTKELIEFPSQYHNPALTSNQTWVVPLSQVLNNTSVDLSSEWTQFAWIELGIPGGIGPSATGVFVAPDRFFAAGITPKPYNNTIACSIDATWIPSEAWIDPATDDIVHEIVTDPLQERYYFEGSHKSIKITLDWLNFINILYDNSTSNVSMTTFEQLANRCISQIPHVEDCMEASLALFLADAMARVQAYTSQIWIWQGNLTLYFPEPINTTKIPGNSLSQISPIFESWIKNSPNDMTKFSIEMYKYGYGYGLKGSSGIYIAIAVLLIHVVFALAHMIIIITGKWSSGAWDNLGELIALAVNSSPSKLLQNTCAGIEDPKTWTQIVSVRETSEAHLEIVFEEANHDFMHQKDSENYESIGLEQRKYSAAKREDQLRKRVIPGKKYGKLK